MKQNKHPIVDHFLHPYVFLLKEGKTIEENPMDYSLLMLRTGYGDILHSPRKKGQSSNPHVQLLKK